MRKTALILLMIIITVSSLSAAAVPAPGIRDTDSWVRHPGLLAETESKTTFGIKAGFGSDVAGLSFLANPVGSLQKAAAYMQKALYESDDEFLAAHYDDIASALSADLGFPTRGNTDEETAYFVREYFKEGGRFETVLSDENKAWAAANALSKGVVDYPSSLITSGMTLDLVMDGGEVKDGFGWNWNVNFFFDGASSLLPQMSSADYTYGNEFGLAFGADLGYGAYVYDDILAVGFSASPQVYFRSSFLNADYLIGRLSGNPFSLLASNIFYLGIGIDLNLGLLYNINDELSLSFDLKHIPSLQTYWYFTAEDFLTSFAFHHDDNLYFEPFDATLTLFLDYGSIRGEVMLCNIFDQLIVLKHVNGYRFDPWTLFQLHAEYDLNESVMLYMEYARRNLYFGVETGGFTVEIFTALDALGFGVSVGYEF